MTMYLSRCELNPQKRGFRRLLGNPQMMHAAVLSCFPRTMTEENGRVLWRVDYGDQGTYLYMVSRLQPDLTILQEQAGWPDTPTALSRDYGPFLDRLSEGQVFHFRLTANPTKSEFKHGQRGRVIGHKMPEHQINWLLERAERNGFSILKNESFSAIEVPSVDVIRNEQVSFFKSVDSKRRVSLRQVTFEGLLRVADPNLLMHSLTQGIGRGKAYGCGLITLSPVS